MTKKKKKRMTWSELTTKLDGYTDPKSQDFDPVFTEKLRSINPTWGDK